MSTFTQAAPQAYPPPTMATIAGGFGSANAAEQFANINVINQLTTSNSTLDDGVGHLTTNVQGMAAGVLAGFYEPNQGTSSIVTALQVGQSSATARSAQISYTNTTTTSGNVAGFGLASQTPGIQVSGAGRVTTPNSVLDDGMGNMIVTNPSAAATSIVGSFNVSSLAANQSAILEVGKQLFTTNLGAAITFTNSTPTTASFGLQAASPGFAVDSNGSSYLPLSINTASKGTNTTGVKPVTVDTVTGLVKTGISGVVNLSGGTATVSNLGIFATSLVFVTAYDTGIGPLVVSVGGGSFTVTDQSGSSTGPVAYMVI